MSTARPGDNSLVGAASALIAKGLSILGEALNLKPKIGSNETGVDIPAYQNVNKYKLGIMDQAARDAFA
jgi:hypothetical protein